MGGVSSRVEKLADEFKMRNSKSAGQITLWSKLVSIITSFILISVFCVGVFDFKVKGWS